MSRINIFGGEVFSLISISNIVTVLVALCGWLVVHKLTQSREISAARRNLRASYLMGAYRSIENSIYRELLTEDKRKLEQAFSDIELLGSREQVNLVHELIIFKMRNPDKKEEIANQTLLLLDSLRGELRCLFEQDDSKLERRVILRLGNKPE